MKLLRKYGFYQYNDYLLRVIKNNTSEHDFKKFEKVMERCLKPALENGDIINGTRLKADMQEKINNYLTNDEFVEAKKVMNEISLSDHFHMFDDDKYYFTNDKDRHALSVGEIVMLYDFDV